MGWTMIKPRKIHGAKQNKDIFKAGSQRTKLETQEAGQSGVPVTETRK